MMTNVVAHALVGFLLLLTLELQEVSSFSSQRPFSYHQQQRPEKIDLKNKQGSLLWSTTSSDNSMEQQEAEQEKLLHVTNAMRIAEAEEEHRMLYQKEHELRKQRVRDLNNDAIMGSFKTVEGTALSLLNNKPFIAVTIFVALGLVAAYISGFVMLDGFISSPNPYENGEVPYLFYDEAETTVVEAETAAAAVETAVETAVTKTSELLPQ